MSFAMVSGVGRRIGVLDAAVIVEKEGIVLGMKVGRPIVTNGNFVV